MTLPRFSRYEKTLPIDGEFENALVAVYTEVICFYARTIHFYRSNPHHLLRCKAWADFQGDFGKTIQRIKRLSSNVESEAEIARMKMQKDGYAEVLELMKNLKETRLENEGKPCYHVPFSPNPHFGGRQDALSAVKKALDPNTENDRQQSFGLWGMGGVGKTQVALQYAASSRQNFDSILWISAENSIQSSQGFGDVARRLGLVQNEMETEDAMASMIKVKEWMLDTCKFYKDVALVSLKMQKPNVGCLSSIMWKIWNSFKAYGRTAPKGLS